MMYDMILSCPTLSGPVKVGQCDFDKVGQTLGLSNGGKKSNLVEWFF